MLGRQWLATPVAHTSLTVAWDGMGQGETPARLRPPWGHLSEFQTPLVRCAGTASYSAQIVRDREGPKTTKTIAEGVVLTNMSHVCATYASRELAIIVCLLRDEQRAKLLGTGSLRGGGWPGSS